MNPIQEASDKLKVVKDKVVGDLHDVILRLEAVLQHLQISSTETVIKDAVAHEVSSAAVSVGHVADTLRSEVDDADVTADSTVNAVESAVSQ